MGPLLVDKTALRLLIASAALNLLAWSVLLIRFVPSIRRGLVIALHYNVYLNIDEIGSAWLALLPAILGTVLGAANVALAARIYASNRLNALIFLAITSFYEALLLAASVFVVLINAVM